MYKKVKDFSTRETMKRYPRITAHIIAESLDPFMRGEDIEGRKRRERKLLRVDIFLL